MVSIQVINEFEDPDIENERKKVLALPPKLKNTPLLFKELTKVKSFNDQYCPEL